MRVVIQRVQKATLSIENKTWSEIDSGLLILLGIEENDTTEDVDWLCKKISLLRIFPDVNGAMNLSINEVAGDIMVISQFTLHAKTKKGNRPSFIKAARPESAIPLYEEFIEVLEKLIRKEVKRGVFGAYMQVSLVNDGPVTILIDTKNKE
ncbi:MAG: D-aminoacyl-tRNA deacylase [Bacteroidota bacterium]|nr:D-aminoacyl-tRNA deacylase [Bacteroidota bacterium]